SVTGVENFAFIPQELLTNLSTLMENPDGTKIYGLDGRVVAWIHDADGDNAITAGGSDHAYIYFSMRRGGKNIYALDVTNRDAPELMWVIKGGIGDYAELSDTWSTINVKKIKDGDTEKTVLIFGGGYDESQDSAIVRTTDSKGRAVFIADALSGARLWSGGEGGDLTVEDMDYSIPARVQPLDVSGDGYIDRIYAVDMGGQIFRFDINNTNGAGLSSSISGARIADLAGTAAEDARRFYYPPDVALVTDDSGKYNALVLSSGYRAHPLNTTIHDRIYMIKDKQTAFTTTYPASVTEGDLKDVTLNLAGGDSGAAGNVVADAAREAELVLIQAAEGWYIGLDDEDNSDTWIGEKGLAEALLVEGVAIVTTYTPNVKPAENVCGPALGLGKVFYLDILDATPAFPSSVDERSERHIELKHSGIPPTPHLIVPDGEPPCVAIGARCDTLNLGLGIRKTYWFEEEK
ncbi:MAG: pilus assembly protein PilY, partial [Gammaproteobacteria bacterium]|nr:pilus assembly protein PilY [Gammaproteobacteria bacterium]